MNQINLNNYEAYLLDFSEGNLSEEMQLELELFLIQHPELGVDLNELSLINIELESVSFHWKKQLKKTESKLVSETQFINYIEGLSNNEEKLHIENSCASNPKLHKELVIFNHTIAQPDLSIVYKNKARLKRQTKVIWFNLNTTRFAAAASVLLVLGLFFLWPPSKITDSKTELAKHDSATKSNSKEISPDQSIKIASKDQINDLNEKIVKEKRGPIVNRSYVSNNEALIAHTNTFNPIENNVPQVISIDNKTPHIEEKLVLNTNEVNSDAQNTKVIATVTEQDEETPTEVSSKKKKGIWSIAEKALKNLNTLGVKSVNGETDDKENSETYALTLGGLSITHKKSGEKL